MDSVAGTSDGMVPGPHIELDVGDMRRSDVTDDPPRDETISGVQISADRESAPAPRPPRG